MSWGNLGYAIFRKWDDNDIGAKLFPKRAARIEARRAAKRIERTSEGIEYDITETTTMGKYLKSRTIQGLLASGVAGGLGLLIGDAEAAELAPQAAEWVLNGLQLAGLVWAAYGRKKAQGPL